MSRLFFAYFLSHHLALRNWIRWIFTPIPETWGNGTKGDILLIPGFASGWNFLQTIGNFLNAEGYRIHPLKKLDMNVHSVSHCVNEIQSYLDNQKLNQVILLGHSKGGLLAVLSFEKNFSAKKVSKVITIATPFAGSQRAQKFRWFFNLADISPNSSAIRRVVNLKPELREQIINLYPRIDKIVVPKTSLILNGATNIEVNVSGHTQILESPKTLNLIKKCLFPKS